MYMYSCSKECCGSTWLLKEGNLNGFVLTCPVCGKGRGIFSAQTKRVFPEDTKAGVEEIKITFGVRATKGVEDVNTKLDEFAKRNFLKIIDQHIEMQNNEYTCTVIYKKQT